MAQGIGWKQSKAQSREKSLEGNAQEGKGSAARLERTTLAEQTAEALFKRQERQVPVTANRRKASERPCRWSRSRGKRAPDAERQATEATDSETTEKPWSREKRQEGKGRKKLSGLRASKVCSAPASRGESPGDRHEACRGIRTKVRIAAARNGARSEACRGFRKKTEPLTLEA